MTSNAMFAEIAALLGDPGRAAMLHALLGGEALTATELARVAGISPQTASGHLSQMLDGGLLRVDKQGRQRLHRLALPTVARTMESIMQLASDVEAQRKRTTVSSKDKVLHNARTCYDHLAGRLGVALADGLVAGGYVELAADAGVVTPKGLDLFARLGIQIDASASRPIKRSRRILCRPCLDWTERRLHIGGAVGAALCTHSFAKGWIRRIAGTRAVDITPKGRRELREAFGIEWD